jgi:hypothetical protein
MKEHGRIMMETKPVKMLCLGVVPLVGGKKGYEFEWADEPDRRNLLLGSSKVTNRCYAGCYYSISSDGESFYGDFMFAGTIEDDKRRALLQLESKANQMVFDMQAQNKKEGYDYNSLRRVLLPIINLANRTNSQGRAAIIARVIEMINKG